MLKHLAEAHNLFALGAILSGLAFIVITPPFWGADEGQHFIRAYQVSQGILTQHKVTIDGKTSQGGSIPASFVRLDKLREKDITDAVLGETKQVDARGAYDQVANVPTNHDQLKANPYGKNIYFPIVYGAPALGIVVGSLFSHMPLALLYSARIATLSLYVLLIFIAIYILRRTVIKWLVFVVALLPMSMFQAAMVGPDPLLLGLTFVFFSVLYVSFHSDNRIKMKEIAILLLTAGLLTLVKMPYLILVSSLAFIPLHNNVTRQQKLVIRIGIPLVCIFAALISLANARSIAGVPIPGISLGGQLHFIFAHPFQYVYTLINSTVVLDWVPQMVGLLGSSFIFIPGVAFQSLLIGLVLVAFLDTNKITGENDGVNKRSATVYLCASFLTASAIITTLYLTWTPVGAKLVEGVQGRYFLPIIVFALAGLRMLTSARLVVSRRGIVIFCSVLSSTSLLASVLWLYRILY